MRKTLAGAPLAVALAAILGAGALAGGALAQQPPAPPPARRVPRGLAGAGLTQAQVDAAVERGKTYLVKRLGWNPKLAVPDLGDEQHLIVLALAHTDAFTRDRTLARQAIAGLYRDPKVGKTYRDACATMALEALGGGAHAARIAQHARGLASQQNVDKHHPGGWSYGGGLDQPKLVPPELELADPVLEVSGGVAIASSGTAATLDAPESRVHSGPDGSCSQFALLGLHSAATVGVVASESVFAAARDYFTDAQRPDGGWAYHPDDKSSYGSMTCAGITGLAIALGHTGVPDVAADARIQRGVAWLAEHWTFEKNPEAPRGFEKYHMYYVYGLERVGVLLGTDFVGEHEWYPEGARWLLDRQQPDGSWKGLESQVLETCYALLFLTRATTPLAVPKGGLGTLRTQLTGPNAPAPGTTGLHFILDASDSMNDRIGGRSKWEIVKEAAKKIVAALPDDAIVGLRVYGHNPSNPRKVDERETELLMPIGKLDRAKLESIVDGITPRGRTPIAMSFDRCANDLASAPPCRVLLLSDGAETGGGDPVASAKVLAQNPKCLAIDCLGFDLASEPRARAQLYEIALLARGRFTESNEPDVLARAGARTNPEYAIVDASGKESRGTLGDSRPLPEGHYRFRVTVASKVHEATFWVNTGAETVVAVHPENAR